jgi:peptidoglycan/xylan/chitin deacetylase (PgdA/CDA1 family)
MSALASPRAAARALAAASGALALRHRLRNRATLTALMFHRVVEPGTPAARHADVRYTLTAPVFAACLHFLAQHYSVVGLEAVLAARLGGAPLPPRALLITFDDGWADNLTVALPLLRARGLPAALFVATDPVADATPWWWQEVLLRALREGRTGFAALWAAAGGAPRAEPPPGAREHALLRHYGALDPAARAAALAPFLDDDLAREGRHMIAPADLGPLRAGGFAIGAHGAAHLPLSLLAEPSPDIARARAALAGWLAEGAPAAFSFPHGSYHDASLAAVWAAGFGLALTSDPCLNLAPGGRPASALLGRISVDAGGITDAAGDFSAARMATWLFHRPIRRLEAGSARARAA